MPAPKVTDVDEADAPPAKVVEQESRFDVSSESAVAQAADKPAPSSDVVSSQFIEFEATLDKSGGEKLGLDISAYDGKTLLVGRVKPGPVERWNTQHAAQWEMCILRGDRVIAINGVRGDSDELLGAARADVLNMTICRRIEFAVTIEYNANDNFGLDFEDTPDRCVVISSVNEGIAADSNQYNPADMEIRPGDQVLQLNGADAEGAEAVRTTLVACASSNAAGTLSFRLRRVKPTQK